MPALPDAGDRGPGAAGADGASWVLEDPEGVVFRLPGSKDSIWRSNHVIVTRLRDAGLLWDRYDLATIYLSHISGLLLGQGLPPSALFPEEGYILSTGTVFTGPFLYLKGTVLVASPPPRLVDVVLGHLVHYPPDVDPVSLLGHLVQAAIGR